MSARAKVERRGRRGQPSVSGSRLLIRLRPADFDRYTAIAKSRGLHLAQWMRQACYLAARGQLDMRAASGAPPPSEQLTRRTQIPLRPSEMAAWERLAHEVGLTLSAWMRQAAYLAASQGE